MYNRIIFIIFCTITVIVSTMAFLGCNSSHSTGNLQSASFTQINKDVIAALQEIVALREEEIKVTQAKYENGHASSSELEDAQNRLSEARIRLVTTQHQPDIVIEELRKILATHEKRFQRIEARVAQGLASSSDVVEAKIQLLEARIRLAKAIQRRE